MKARVRAWPRSLFLLLGGLALAGVSLAATLDLSWTGATRLSAPPGPAWYPQLALDATSGDLFVVWTEGEPAAGGEILGRRWDRAGGTWTAIESLSGSQGENSSPLLFFDSRGQGLLIWTRRYSVNQGAPSPGTDLVWRAWDGAGWSAEQVLLHNDFFLPGTYHLIPVEMPDAILIFITFGYGYQTTEYWGGSWSELSPWEYLTFQDPFVRPILAQILRDDGGLLHAAAFGENSAQQGTDAAFQDAYYLTYDGVQWSTPLNLSYTDGVASSLGMAFDGQGRLHFLWSDPRPIYSTESDKSAIWERVYSAGTWSSTNSEVTIYNQDQAIADFSLTADLSGTLHLAWSEGVWNVGAHSDLDIYYQTGDGTTWGPEEEVHTSIPRSRYPSLVVSDDGAAVAWQEGTVPDQQVYFSRRLPPQPYSIYLPLVNR